MAGYKMKNTLSKKVSFGIWNGISDERRRVLQSGEGWEMKVGLDQVTALSRRLLVLGSTKTVVGLR